MTEVSRTAAIYARISQDKVGAGLGVERQETDCRELAARLGWSVVEVFCDNDLSAYSGKARPRYRALLEAIRAGRVGAVLAGTPTGCTVRRSSWRSTSRFARAGAWSLTPCRPGR